MRAGDARARRYETQRSAVTTHHERDKGRRTKGSVVQRPRGKKKAGNRVGG